MILDMYDSHVRNHSNIIKIGFIAFGGTSVLLDYVTV